MFPLNYYSLTVYSRKSMDNLDLMKSMHLWKFYPKFYVNVMCTFSGTEFHNGGLILTESTSGLLE